VGLAEIIAGDLALWESTLAEAPLLHLIIEGELYVEWRPSDLTLLEAGSKILVQPHAREQIEARGMTLIMIMSAIRNPEQSGPSRQDPQNKTHFSRSFPVEYEGKPINWPIHVYAWNRPEGYAVTTAFWHGTQDGMKPVNQHSLAHNFNPFPAFRKAFPGFTASGGGGMGSYRGRR
jgi:hypothetical protein